MHSRLFSGFSGAGLSEVMHVIDGDTAEIKIGDKVESVRFLGINTPEVANPYKKEECYGPEASRRTKELIKAGESVYLIPDTFGPDRDKYGRLLRYIFLSSGLFVNAELIREGYAFNYIYDPFEFMQQFDYYEKEARTKKLGLWSSACDYNQNK